MSKISTTYAEFPGYTNRIEVTNTPNPSFMVAGSKNVVVDWLNTISSRAGFELLGEAGSVGGVQGWTDWRTSRGQFFNIRKIGKELQVLRKVDDAYSWVTIWNTTGTDEFADKVATFGKVWNDTRKVDELLLAAGNVKFYSWSGATASIASTTVNTIICNEALGVRGFAATGDIYINGNNYAYTGVAGNTLTGVTPDPTGETTNSFVNEAVKAQSIPSLPDNFTCDYLGVYRNQAYVGSATSRIALVSSAVNYTDFVSSTAVGGARTLTLDDNVAGFEASKDSMTIFGQSESLFKIKQTISADQTKEFYEIERLATSPQQGLISPLAKLRVKNAIVYITREKTLDTVEFVENIQDLQTVPISDIIKNDFDATDFTGASIGYWDSNLLIICPASNVTYMYDMERKIWQPPIIWNGAILAGISVTEEGALIGHDAIISSSYLLLTGNTDNGNAIESKAVFAYNNLGERFAIKRLTRFVQDGYISVGGKLDVQIDYDYEGVKGSNSYSFQGSELDYVFDTNDVGSIGKSPLGERPLSGSSLLPQPDQRRFRFAESLPPLDFYEYRLAFSMNTSAGSWRLVAFGSDVTITNTEINDITRR